MQDSSYLAFGTLVRTYRRAARMTQEELATQAGISVYSISNIERGVAHVPRKATLQLLAHALHLDAHHTAELLQVAQREESPEPKTPQPSPQTPLWNVPLRRNPFFTGRTETLHQVHEFLHSDSSRPGSYSCTLSGLGGMGKTQAALEYAYHYATAYTAILWISAETLETIRVSILTIVPLITGAEEHEQEPAKAFAAFSRWLRQTTGWLLIWDNIESPEVVQSLLPPVSHGALLFTSRRQALPFSAHVLTLPPLTVAEGTHFLLVRTRLGDPARASDALSPQDVATAQAITRAVDGLPLALDQAGAYIEATQCRLDEYLHLIQVSPMCLLTDRELSTDHPASLVTTVTIAFSQIQQANPFAAELLMACAFLDPDKIPQEVFRDGSAQFGGTIAAAGGDWLSFQTAMKTILTYSLVQRDAETQTLTIHRLVQTILKATLAEPIRQQWGKRMMTVLAALFPSSDTTNGTYWQTCQRLLAHAVVCLNMAEVEHTDILTRVTLMHHVAYYLTNLAQFAEAERYHLWALQLSEQILDPSHPMVTSVFNRLGRLYKEQGRYAEAEALLLRAVALQVQMLGPQHYAVARYQNNLAILYAEQGKYAEAEPLYLSALHIQEQAFGPDHPLGASVMNNLGVLYNDQGRYVEAEPLFRHALSLWQQAFGTEHLKVALPLNNLAEIAVKQGRYAEAEPLLLNALELTEQALGSEHLHVAYLLINLGDLAVALKRDEEAQVRYQRALAIKQHIYPPLHNDILLLQQKLAKVVVGQSANDIS